MGEGVSSAGKRLCQKSVTGMRDNIPSRAQSAHLACQLSLARLQLRYIALQARNRAVPALQLCLQLHDGRVAGSHCGLHSRQLPLAGRLRLLHLADPLALRSGARTPAE